MDAKPEKISLDPLHHACQALSAGQIIAHPTETVFGLAVDPWQPTALHHLLQLKGRTAIKGFILLIPDRQALEQLVLPPPPLARILMDHFWPGPLTLVLPARPGLPLAVTGDSGWVAVRHSSSPVVQALLRLWQRPLVSTSANSTGQPPARSATAVRQLWGHAIPIVLEGETPPEAQPSTLLRVEGDRIHLLRAGAITSAQWQAVLSGIERAHHSRHDQRLRPWPP